MRWKDGLITTTIDIILDFDIFGQVKSVICSDDFKDNYRDVAQLIGAVLGIIFPPFSPTIGATTLLFIILVKNVIKRYC